MKPFARFALLAIAIAAATWLIGWYAVPALGLVAGIARVRPSVVSLAAVAGWLALLMLDVAAGLTRLDAILAGIMGLPAPALFAVTLIFPALLGWSAASVGDAALGLRAISRQPS